MVGKGFKFSIGRSLAKLLFWGALALLFLLCNKYIFKNVKADTLFSDYISVWNKVYFNDYKLFDNIDNINRKKKTVYNNPMDLKMEIALFENNQEMDPIPNIVGKKILTTIEFCSQENFGGVTSAGNLTGKGHFIKSYKTIKKTNGCQIPGETTLGYAVKMAFVWSPTGYRVDMESTQKVIEIVMHYWGGGYNVGNKYVYLENISSVELTPALETQMENLEIQGQMQDNMGVINSNINEVNEGIGNINDSLTDTTAPSTDKFSNLAGWLPHQPLEVLVNLPLNITTAFNNSFSGSCRPYSIPFLGNTITFPCVIDKITPHLGSLVPIIDECVAIFIYIQIIMALYKFVHDLMELRDDSYIETVWTEPGKERRIYK